MVRVAAVTSASLLFPIIVFAFASSPSGFLIDSLGLGLASPTSQPLRLAASTDRTGGNNDYVALQPGQTVTALRLKGPVTIYRFWYTGESVRDLVVKVRVIDNSAAKQPVVPCGLDNGNVLSERHLTSHYCYKPRTVARSLELTVTNLRKQPNKFFYQVNYRDGITKPTIAEYNQAVNLIKRRLSGEDLAKASWVGKESVMSGRGSSITVEALGPAITRALEIQLQQADIKVIDDLELKVTYDGERVPGINSRLNSLFAQYHSLQPYASAFASVGAASLWKRGTRWTLRLPMPYQKGIRIVLTNRGSSTITASVRHVAQPLPQTLPYRLCAESTQVVSQRGGPLTLFDRRGEGNLVGINLDVAGTFHRNFAMLEGDEIIEVDDRKPLMMQGTGTEDWFNSSWYFPDKPFWRPFHGLTHKSTPPATITAYRWFWTDRIPFKQHLRLLLEHGGRNNTDGITYRAVAFWYQKP